MPNDEYFFDCFSTPLGEAQLVCDGEGRLRLFGWYEGLAWRSRFGEGELVCRRDPFGLSSAIGEYFCGHIAAIDALPVVFCGTPFQTVVWRALRSIPAGETLSYGALANRIGQPKAVRAVGLANGANPIAVVVPCHRVVGSDGSLTGYGGGLERKKWLLAHEARCVGTGLFGAPARP